MTGHQMAAHNGTGTVVCTCGDIFTSPPFPGLYFERDPETDAWHQWAAHLRAVREQHRAAARARLTALLDRHGRDGQTIYRAGEDIREGAPLDLRDGKAWALTEDDTRWQPATPCTTTPNRDTTAPTHRGDRP